MAIIFNNLFHLCLCKSPITQISNYSTQRVLTQISNYLKLKSIILRQSLESARNRFSRFVSAITVTVLELFYAAENGGQIRSTSRPKNKIKESTTREREIETCESLEDRRIRHGDDLPWQWAFYLLLVRKWSWNLREERRLRLSTFNFQFSNGKGDR